MNCPTCNHEIPANAKFCNECGAKVENQGKTCPNEKCKRSGLPAEAKFCPDCGTMLTETSYSSVFYDLDERISNALDFDEFTDILESIDDESNKIKQEWVITGVTLAQSTEEYIQCALLWSIVPNYKEAIVTMQNAELIADGCWDLIDCAEGWDELKDEYIEYMKEKNREVNDDVYDMGIQRCITKAEKQANSYEEWEKICLFWKNYGDQKKADSSFEIYKSKIDRINGSIAYIDMPIVSHGTFIGRGCYAVVKVPKSLVLKGGLEVSLISKNESEMKTLLYWFVLPNNKCESDYITVDSGDQLKCILRGTDENDIKQSEILRINLRTFKPVLW